MTSGFLRMRTTSSASSSFNDLSRSRSVLTTYFELTTTILSYFRARNEVQKKEHLAVCFVKVAQELGQWAVSSNHAAGFREEIS